MKINRTSPVTPPRRPPSDGLPDQLLCEIGPGSRRVFCVETGGEGSIAAKMNVLYRRNISFSVLISLDDELATLGRKE